MIDFDKVCEVNDLTNISVNYSSDFESFTVSISWGSGGSDQTAVYYNSDLNVALGRAIRQKNAFEGFTEAKKAYSADAAR